MPEDAPTPTEPHPWDVFDESIVVRGKPRGEDPGNPSSESYDGPEPEGPYNEAYARAAFGEDFFVEMVRSQQNFKGDWSQLAMLISISNATQRGDDTAQENWNAWPTPGIRIRLTAADLSHARLENARLIDARLENARLIDARLENANLYRARLENARLAHANLRGSDLRFATGVLFDSNPFGGFQIEGDARDPWSVLRRAYSGPRFFVHLILLVAFFLPYVANAAFLTVASDTQLWLLEDGGDLVNAASRAARLQQDDPDSPRPSLDNPEAWFLARHEHRPVLLALVGYTKGPVLFASAMVVVVFNALRAFLTLRVSSLREAEDRSGITPGLWEYYGEHHPLAEEPGLLPALRGTLRAVLTFEISGQSLPRRIADTFGLYRIHVIASTLQALAAVAFAISMTYWAGSTWVWAPR